jgi:hypothetical protein
MLQESRPLGATLVSGCAILSGCEEEDDASGVGRPMAFRLKLASGSRNRGQDASTTILCLAADNQDNLDKWLHSVAHSAQNANTDRVIYYYCSARWVESKSKMSKKGKKKRKKTFSKTFFNI